MPFEYNCSPLYDEPDPDIEFRFGDYYADEGMQRALVRQYMEAKRDTGSAFGALSEFVDKYCEAMGAVANETAERLKDALAKIVPSHRTPADQKKLYVVGGRGVGKHTAGLSLHAAWADEADRWGPPITVGSGHGTAMHYEFMGTWNVEPMRGYKGREARRREARGKDPYDDPSRDRTSPAGFRPSNRVRPPRNL